MNLPLPKSIFLELSRYAKFLEYVAQTGLLPDLPSPSKLQAEEFKVRYVARKELLTYLHARLDTVNSIIAGFLADNPAFWGVVFAINKMAAEYTISQKNNPEKLAARERMVWNKVAIVKELLIQAKLPNFNAAALVSRLNNTVTNSYHLSYDFKDHLTDKIKDSQYETVNALYDYAASMIERFVGNKEHNIKHLNKIMASDDMVRDFFDRVVIINLDRRKDRWEAVQRKLEAIKWPFKTPERFSAYDGSKLPVPVGWTSGSGTWGCLLSHREVIGRALQDGLDSVLVLEDDIFFADNFEERVIEFLKNVPSNWHQIMLGGQYLEGAKAYDISPDVRKVSLCHRAHAYAVRGPFMRYVFSKLQSSYGHVDHIMNTFQDRYNVYAPRYFLVGQEGSPSDISDAKGSPDLMRNPPDKDAPVFLIKPDVDVLNAVVSSSLPLHYGSVDASGANAALMAIYRAAASNNKGITANKLVEFLTSGVWYARSVYPSKYFTILNPQGVLLDELKTAAKGLNLIYIESLDQLQAAIAANPFGEDLPTQFPE